MSEFMKPKMTFEDHLKFTPYAWAKLIWMRDRGDTEVAGYGITATEDPLLVTDFVLVKQECTGASFEFDDDDAVEFMERMTDAGLPPWAYANILIHTHPGDSPSPSGTDEKNFVKAFSHPNWAIMFIIAQGGETYCRLKINVGPGAIKTIGVAIDWTVPFGGTDATAWETEYKAKVAKRKFRVTGKEYTAFRDTDYFPTNKHENPNDPLWWSSEYDEWTTQQEELDRQIATESEEGYQLDKIDCYWDVNDNLFCWDDEDELWYSYDPIQRQWYVKDLNRNDELVQIMPPNKHWVEQVVLLANNYGDERSLSSEEMS